MIFGLDPSLTSTGVATRLDDGNELARPATIKSKATGPLRLVEIRDVLRDLIPPNAAVYIEGYSFSSRFSRAHALGELGGVIRVDLWERGIRCVEVAPKMLKSWAVGKGNAGKEEMLAAAIRGGYEGHDNNEADAWWLAHLGWHVEAGSEGSNETRRKILEQLRGAA